MALTLITATTDAVSTKAEYVCHSPPATVFAVGLAGAEEADLFISPDNGTTWQALGLEEGDGSPGLVTLTATRTAFTINSPMYLGVTKDASVGAAGVYVSDREET